MDDPIQRETALSHLFTLQSQVNKGRNLDEIENLEKPDYTPEIVASKFKEKDEQLQPAQKINLNFGIKEDVEMNDTKKELAKVIEMRIQQLEELDRAMKQIREIKERGRSSQGVTTAKKAEQICAEEEDEYEYYSEASLGTGSRAVDTNSSIKHLTQESPEKAPASKLNATSSP